MYNKNYYIGEFKNGKFHGYGEIRYANSEIIQGIFENGVYLGSKKDDLEEDED